MRSFGEQVRAFRETHDLKLTWFAGAAGVSPALLSTVERGRRRVGVRVLRGVLKASRLAGGSAEDIANIAEAGVAELERARATKLARMERTA